jgi:hypothetical protein
MPQASIENPVLNSPFEVPNRHFKFSDDGNKDEIALRIDLLHAGLPVQDQAQADQLACGGSHSPDELEQTVCL